MKKGILFVLFTGALFAQTHPHIQEVSYNFLTQVLTWETKPHNADESAVKGAMKSVYTMDFPSRTMSLGAKTAKFEESEAKDVTQELRDLGRFMSRNIAMADVTSATWSPKEATIFIHTLDKDFAVDSEGEIRTTTSVVAADSIISMVLNATAENLMKYIKANIEWFAAEQSKGLERI